MDVETAVRFASDRLRLAAARRDAVRAFGSAALVAGAAVVGLALAGWRADVGRGVVLAGALALPAVVAAAAFAVRLLRGRSEVAARADLQRAAVELDLRLGLAERVSTASFLAAGGGPDEVASVVRGQAGKSLDAVGAERLRRAFPLPSARPMVAAAAALAVVALVHPWLPAVDVGGPGAPAVDPAAALREKQEVREAARRLEKSAAEIERAAERAELERARRAARKLADEARKMQTDAPSKRDAMVRLAKMDDAVAKEKRDLFGAVRGDPGEAFGAKAEDGVLEELACEIDRLDPKGLEADLDALRKQLRERMDGLGEAGAPDGRRSLGLVDRRRVRDLMDRTEDLQRAFERLRDELARRDAERYQSLSQEASERLAELMEELRRLDRLAEAAGEGAEGMEGRFLTSEELAQLEELLERLAAMSDEEFEELMKALEEMEGLEAAACALAGCQGGLRPGGSGGAGTAAGERLQAMLRRLGSGAGGGGRPNRPGVGEMGPNEGLGRGGAAPKGPDDGRGEEATRVRGRLDPTGDLGPKIPFKGIPNENEAKRAFDDALRRAAAEAEESLGKDLLPPSSRPYVRRYFESLRESSAPAGSTGSSKSEKSEESDGR